jgi:Acyl carrier protein
MRERLIQLLQDVLEEENIDMAADPIEDLGMDSVDIVDYVLRVEEEFGCDIEEFDTLSQHMKTVGDMIDFLVMFLSDGEKTNG